MRMILVKAFWKLVARRWVYPNLSVANRRQFVTLVGNVEVTVTLRNTQESDAYSREELYGMMKTIRKHERIQGWKVPDMVRP